MKLDADWKSGSLGKNIPLTTYKGVITYQSTGPDSDAFVQVLDELYGTHLAGAGMKPQVSFTAISLGGDPRDLAKGRVDIKLFFESDRDDEYAELYTNIDVAKRRLEIHEKDPDYRSPVIKALRSRLAPAMAPSSRTK